MPRSPTDTPKQNHWSTATQATLELVGNTSPVNNDLSVRATAANVRAGRVRSGVRVRGGRTRPTAGAEHQADPELQRIYEVYRKCTGGFGQVVGILRDIRHQQAEHFDRMDHHMDRMIQHMGRMDQHMDRMESNWSKIDNLTAVHRDILTCLCQITTNITPPPCVHPTHVATTSATAILRDEESGVESPSPHQPDTEGSPPSKKRDLPRKRDK